MTSIDPQRPAAEPVKGESAVRTEALTKLYADAKRGEVRALDGLDLDCKYGEIYGLLGPNGAGKSTTLRILATMLAPTSGRATVAGYDVASDSLAVRRNVGFLSASTGLYPRLDVRETLEYFGRMHGLEERALADRIDELIEAFRMDSYVTRRCEHMSSGQKQRVSIARAVLHDPTVLILDEPTTGLDILSTSDMIDFIASRKDSGRCVLFSTHVLSEAERLCDRIGIIHHGRLLGSGTLPELRERTGAEYLDGIFRAFVEVDERAHIA
ncbi:ABC transporter ATP-binding protein [Engelhardtia mirabilis]|uniref:Putative ABC transporter ATP-binding protein YbhF n=1 Tax=Engelhardtia mirabilis TaxID=2528011 RepID=A0A518BKW1_9BACT|nr:putative ABC transporter ATP-binding protein YbhF [Planctomycetes bacterium Pla133]QDV01935.1 putative ABC transporter ATP-binding protein YbhF [Planctomycetes bacterium Pla86]